MPTLIAIDQGTTSTRTVAFDADLKYYPFKAKRIPFNLP
jgi:glycerol kinase